MEFQKKKKTYLTILHRACKLGNLELVKYIISLKKIDITSKTILVSFFNKIFNINN